MERVSFFMPSLAQLEQLLAKTPGDPFLMYGIALEYAKVGQITEACAWFDKTIAADAAYCYAYFHKAKTLADAGRTQDAVVTIKRGLVEAKKCNDFKALSELQSLLDEIE